MTKPSTPPSAPSTKPATTDRGPDPAHPKSGELTALRQVARALAEGTKTSEVLQTICVVATAHGNADGASVAQIRADTGSFVSVHGLASEVLGIHFPLTGSITGRVAEELKLIAIHSAKESSPFLADLLLRLGVGPVLVIPLMAQSKLLGVLSVFRKDGARPFDADDEDRLAAMADLASLALWKAKLLEEVQSADAAKSSLLATLSHELRTPLTALEGYGELLEDEILGPLSEPQRDTIVRLRSVSRHLGTLIEDILTYASLEAGRLTPRYAPVQVDGLIDSLLPYVEPLAREKGLAFTIDLTEGMADFQSDENRLRQILLNLIQNALKFTEVGSVQLRVSPGSPDMDRPASVRFTVRDTGPGIPESDLARLFRPFSQLEDVHSRRHKGTGLGLYISKRLATMLGGRIEVVSRPGDGSQFTLVVPVVR